MSPTTFTADGKVIQHEGETPPAEALTPPAAAPAPEGAPTPPPPPRSQTRKRAGKIAAGQARQRRVGKHRK